MAIDTTLLEASAAMRSIVRRESGGDWKADLTRLMKEEGLSDEDDEPTADELRKFDKGRKQKTVSNREWESESDSDSRIAKMKDGRTHLAYKATHVVDLDSGFLLEACVVAAEEADSSLLVSGVRIAEVVADKSFHKNEVLAACAADDVRTCLPEPQRSSRRWTYTPEESAAAYRSDRRRTQGSRSRKLQRLRSERYEKLRDSTICSRRCYEGRGGTRATGRNDSRIDTRNDVSGLIDRYEPPSKPLSY